MGDRSNHLRTDVLIIGAGAAGLRTAIELAGQDVACLVVGKRSHGDAHTVMAAGGINAALGSLDPDDHWSIHGADTIREGHFVGDARAVEILAREAPDRVRELQEWGCGFDLTDDGHINQRYFGAQSFRRTCFVGDRTGEAVLKTLNDRARTLEVQWQENVYITEILLHGRRAAGAVGFDLEDGSGVVYEADAVVIAAGGYTSAFLRGSSRPDENTGDAASLALRAGCALRDMEFVQFHPTGMLAPEHMRGRLVTEAVRGEGGHLINVVGERFMQRYSPEAMELDARDVVARAIFQEIREGRGTEGGGVWLDISHRDPGFVRERLPKLVARFEELGTDLTRSAIEVAPTAHYGMGGILVDFESGSTATPGLFAVGEATGGLHGANRLGGNSLAETLVFGRRTGMHLASQVPKSDRLELQDHAVEAHRERLIRFARGVGEHDPGQLMQEVRSLLWHHAGIIRTREGLDEGLRALEEVRWKAADMMIDDEFPSLRTAQALDLRSTLRAAECIIRGARRREESRGAHFRADHPDASPEWQRTIFFEMTGDATLQMRTGAVPTPSEDIQRALDEGRHLDYHHLE